MFPRSSKQRQSSPAREDSGYWFELPDIPPRKKRRRRFRVLTVGVIAATTLLLLALLHGVL